MSEPFAVDPGELRSVADNVNDLSSSLNEFITSLNAQLAGEGAPWGDDSVGDTFANGDGGYLAQLNWVNGGMNDRVQFLQNCSDSMLSSANSFQQHDEQSNQSPSGSNTGGGSGSGGSVPALKQVKQGQAEIPRVNAVNGSGSGGSGSGGSGKSVPLLPETFSPAKPALPAEPVVGGGSGAGSSRTVADPGQAQSRDGQVVSGSGSGGSGKSVPLLPETFSPVRPASPADPVVGGGSGAGSSRTVADPGQAQSRDGQVVSGSSGGVSVPANAGMAGQADEASLPSGGTDPVLSSPQVVPTAAETSAGSGGSGQPDRVPSGLGVTPNPATGGTSSIAPGIGLVAEVVEPLASPAGEGVSAVVGAVQSAGSSGGAGKVATPAMPSEPEDGAERLGDSSDPSFESERNRGAGNGRAATK